jgi:catechol-2,3-dioxygenase
VGGIRGLGELALRVADLDAMRAFYRDVVGLEILDESVPGSVFFRVAAAVEGHPQTLVLFDRGVELDRDRTTVDHFAFLIDLEDYDPQRDRLEGLGIAVRLKEFPHFHWRALFFQDPEGHSVEFVCYDPTVA